MGECSCPRLQLSGWWTVDKKEVSVVSEALLNLKEALKHQREFVPKLEGLVQRCTPSDKDWLTNQLTALYAQSLSTSDSLSQLSPLLLLTEVIL